MKKILLLICAMAVVTGTTAQTGNKKKGFWSTLKETAGQMTSKKKKAPVEKQEAEKDCWEYMMMVAKELPPIRVDDKLVSQESGFTLVKTNTIGGMKCEHYEKDGKQIRIFYKETGDFFIDKADPDGMNREPDKYATSLSMWRITFGSVAYYGGFKYYTHVWDGEKWGITETNCRLHQHSNGNQSYEYTDDKINPTYEDFKNGDPWKCLKKWHNPKLVFQGARLASDSLNIFYPYCNYSNRETYLKFSEQIIGFSKGSIPTSVRIGDYFYRWDPIKGEKDDAVAQLFEGKAICVRPNNKVVSINEIKDESRPGMSGNKLTKVTYENGDFFTLGYGEDLNEARLHFGEDVLVIMPDQSGGNIRMARIEYADGSIFSGVVRPISSRGEIEEGIAEPCIRELGTLLADQIVPRDGTFQDAEGNLWEYVNGVKKR